MYIVQESSVNEGDIVYSIRLGLLRVSPVKENMPIWLIMCSQVPGVPLAFRA